MYHLQRDPFSRVTVSLVLILSLITAPCFLGDLFSSDLYAAQSDDDATLAEKEKVCLKEVP
jgi:hypothetical protein